MWYGLISCGVQGISKYSVTDRGAPTGNGGYIVQGGGGVEGGGG